MSSPTKKFHLSLNVADLNRSVEFYTKVLGVAPAKHHGDYAKFELSDPPLVLALEPGRQANQERLNHMGVRLADVDGLRSFAETAQTAGLETQYLQSVECCYSRQTKFCLTDPDNTLVEFYLLEADLEKPTAETKAARSSQGNAQQIAWDHLLGTPFPTRIPLEDGAAREVKLRGTLNLKRDPSENLAILLEARRVLSEEGELTVHLLVADRAIEKKLPRLPGPAALVEHTPTEIEVLKALEAAGFCALHLKRLSHSPVFQFDGAEMRELLVLARVKSSEKAGRESYPVVYKGPFKEVTDDFGVKYMRGMRTQVSSAVFSQLKNSGMADAFVFLNAASSDTCTASAKNSQPSESLQPEL